MIIEFPFTDGADIARSYARLTDSIIIHTLPIREILISCAGVMPLRPYIFLEPRSNDQISYLLAAFRKSRRNDRNREKEDQEAK